MLSQNINWYFPTKLEEAFKLIKSEGIILHGGGTRILKTSPKTIKGLVDVQFLGLNYIENKNGYFYIGSASTFADVIQFSKKSGKLNILANSLSQAASTPLRNRITIGGSIKDFPLWSSLYAPLIALDAKVEIAGLKKKIYTLEDYVNEGIIKTKHLIKHVIIKDNPNLIGGTKRFAILRFEYPIFNISVTFELNNNTINDSRIVITGVRSRYKRFKKIEKIFCGKTLSNEIIAQAVEMFNPKFISDYKF
ncbi:MAG: FAD binding domain-containing protein, partial [Ignavibacteria bacterium]|nr:FAD binding domain-containing protein [Ignavibacteria bacterium]